MVRQDYAGKERHIIRFI